MIQILSRIVAVVLPAAVTGWFLFPMIQRFTGGTPEDKGKVVLFCGLLGLAFALFREYLRFARRRQVEALGDRLSMSFSAEGSQQIAERLKDLSGRSGFVNLENVIQGTTSESDTMLIGDLVRRTTGSKRQETCRQTVVYVSGPDLYLPQFALQPEGRLISFVGDMIGREDIDFSTHPKFSSAYHLSSSEPSATRELFDRRLLDFFAEHPGWEVRAEHKFLMMAQGRLVPVSEWELVREKSIQVLAMLHRSLQNLEGLARPSDEGANSATHSQSDARQGVWPKTAKPAPPTAVLPEPTRFSQLVARHAYRIAPGGTEEVEIDRFIHAPPPRTIPEPIRVNYIGWNNRLTIFLFSFFAVMGAPWLVIGVMSLEGDGIDALIIGLIIELIAAVGLNFAVGSRRRKTRVLREGRLAQGTILEIKGTNVSVNHRQRYLVTIRFNGGNEPRVDTVALYGSHAKQARDLKQRSEETPLLYDPDNPKNFVLGLMLRSQRIQV